MSRNKQISYIVSSKANGRWWEHNRFDTLREARKFAHESLSGPTSITKLTLRRGNKPRRNPRKHEQPGKGSGCPCKCKTGRMAERKAAKTQAEGMNRKTLKALRESIDHLS